MYKFLCVSLLTLPLATQAQTPTRSSDPFMAYVGVGANAGRYYDQQHGEFVGKGLLYSPTVVAGVQLIPRLALQLSATTYEYRNGYSTQSLDYSSGDRNNPQISYVSGTTRRRYFILPLLARYTFASSWPRVKVDGLLGASIYHTRERSTTTVTDDQLRITRQDVHSVSANYANLALGAGVRYALAPRLEVASELRANVFYFGYSGAINPNLDVSLHYCFSPLPAKSAAAAPTPLLPGNER